MPSQWDDDEPKKPKLLNGRYLKIKKLGDGSFCTVYLAEDLLPEGHNRQLSPEVLELVGKIPASETNPYKKINSSYFADYDMMDEGERPEPMDPKLRE